MLAWWGQKLSGSRSLRSLPLRKPPYTLLFCLFFLGRHFSQTAVLSWKRHAMDVFFLSSCRARSRLGRSSKRLVVGQPFSSCKRTDEKQKASECRNKRTLKHKHKPNTTRRKTTSKPSETLRFQKKKSSVHSVLLHDDIAIPANRKMFQVAHSWRKW